MRLLHLKIKNIASLKGEHHVDFTEIQARSSLFAITGETGAGKSSILNSIGLALYGSVYKKNVNQSDVVTLGEKEGQIELIFQAKGHFYLASWKAKVLKPNGEPYATSQPPSRILYSLEKPDFSAPRTASEKKVPELLNLDFDQFCKCIILNQGEFAKFLMSNFTDRKDILEKLYPGELLESLSKELRLELDAFLKQKNDLDIELNMLQGDSLSGESLKEKKSTLENELKFHENYFSLLENIHVQFTSLDHYYQKNVENQRKAEHLKSELTQHTTIFNQCLKDNELALQAQQSAVLQQERDLPQLQELLKQEETLKYQEKALADLSLAIHKTQEKSEDFTRRIKESSSRYQAWLEQKSTLKDSFHFPLDSLKKHRQTLERFFDAYNETELLSREIKNAEEKLALSEASGKEISQALNDVMSRKKELPADIQEALAKLLQQKKDLLSQIEKKQISQLKAKEIEKQLEDISLSLQKTAQRKNELKEESKRVRLELSPIETTLGLQEFMSAVKLCLKHPQIPKDGTCPVCETHIPSEKWLQLQQLSAESDSENLKLKQAELTRTLLKNDEELKLLDTLEQNTRKEHAQKTEELKSWTHFSLIELPEISQIDDAVNSLQKKAWDREALVKEEDKLNQELLKARKAYSLIKSDFLQREGLFKQSQAALNFLREQVTELNIVEISAQEISRLKREVRQYDLYMENEALGEKLEQELKLLREALESCDSDLKNFTIQKKDLDEKTDLLKKNLHKNLGDKQASTLIDELQKKVKELSEKLSQKEKELKRLELTKGEMQSRLSSLSELMKEGELHFSKSLVAIKACAQKLPVNEREESQTLRISFTELALSFTSPAELFLPLKDLLTTEKDFYKEKTNLFRLEFGRIDNALKDWEKKQDRIKVLELRQKDLQQKLGRLQRLSDILGKDDLRTFVLSLVEESLIIQTNHELQKLCQGRYEIIHQTRGQKLAPEFYILDKFREGGRRKVSTLSGGETFMVSLAMALALAEMTRGQAEIDSLFIDEGFGTLDQDSLEDVLEMLQQIQTRGLLVGIISHIKPLTSSLPVNLLVSKQQDGTSSVRLRLN